MRKQSAKLALAPQPEPQPTVPSIRTAPGAVEYAEALSDGFVGRAVHSASLALESIETFSELLAFEALENSSYDAPQLVLSSRQRLALMNGVALLAGSAHNELVRAMGRRCLEGEASGAASGVG